MKRIKDGQAQIFYATGASREQPLKSPHREAGGAKGYELLLLAGSVDDVRVGQVGEF